MRVRNAGSTRKQPRRWLCLLLPILLNGGHGSPSVSGVSSVILHYIWLVGFWIGNLCLKKVAKWSAGSAPMATIGSSLFIIFRLRNQTSREIHLGFQSRGNSHQKLKYLTKRSMYSTVVCYDDESFCQKYHKLLIKDLWSWQVILKARLRILWTPRRLHRLWLSLYFHISCS